MLELFIAKRIYRDKEEGKQVSRPAVLIAMVGIAIGLAVIIVSVAVVIGFKKEVRNKITGFGSDIHIHNFDAIRSYETQPVFIDSLVMEDLAGFPNVVHVQRYSTKPGIIKTDDAFQGIVLKGVGPEYDLEFFRDHLLEGEIPLFSDTMATNQVLISSTIAADLQLSTGDKILTYFIEKEVRARALTVAGIYQTNFSEYDKLFLVTDLYTVNRLNNWESGQVTGAEIRIADYNKLEDTAYDIGEVYDTLEDGYGGTYFVQDVEDLNPQIFAWLGLLDLNVWVILTLMIGVAGFTMISGLLIIILERTNMIGILKALGADNRTIRKIFLWFSVFLIGKGMLWGNAIGLMICFLQSRFDLMKLDPETYYVASVPVSFNIWWFLLLNIGTLLVSVLMLVGPSYLITRIHPAESIRYE
ncbi:MAG: ABC transporter permease [Bacteroides sp.]|nr:ABC transporter permease [Bacteroides sp.]